MNFQVLKQQVCRFLMSVLGFLLLPLACSAAEGVLFLPFALLLGLADLLCMNILCGLAESKPARHSCSVSVRHAQPAAAHPPVAIRVVRGGRVA